MSDETTPRRATEARFIDLETRLAYQDQLLRDLHEVLLSRGKQIDALEMRIEALSRRLREDEEPVPPAERPPHY